jgi:uncharacterized membrane protein (UPF0127 family)
VLALVLVSCTQPPQSASNAVDATRKVPEAAAQVVLYPASGAKPATVQVELARTDEEHTRGLMFRRELGPSSGMLFLFDHAEVRRFWMRNTFIPLDMLFFDAERRVVGIEEQTTPHDETGRGPDEPAQYVLEVPGGYARRHGIGIGSRAEFVHVN